MRAPILGGLKPPSAPQGPQTQRQPARRHGFRDGFGRSPLPFKLLNSNKQHRRTIPVELLRPCAACTLTLGCCHDTPSPYSCGRIWAVHLQLPFDTCLLDEKIGMSDPGLRRQIACTPEEQRPSTAGRVSIPCCFVLRVCAPVSQTHRLVLDRLSCSFSFLSSCRSLLEAVTQPDLYYHYTNMYYGQSSFMFTGVTSGIFLPTEWVVVERRTSIGRDTLMIRRLAAFWICRAVSRIVKKKRCISSLLSLALQVV